MTNDITQAIKNEFHLHNFGLKYKHTGSFIRCQWQRGRSASVGYLVYRCVVAAYFLVTLFMCMCNVGQKYDEARSFSKWSIYLTNWGYTVYTVQACLGSFLLVQRLVEEGKSDATLKTDGTATWCVQLYWVVHTIAVVIAFSITGSFWVAIFDPAQHELGVLSVVSHILNSVVMGLDLLLVAHPIRLLHVHWPVGFLASYFAFSLFYFWLGGTDLRGQHMIYSILDWKRPLRTVVICLMALTYVALTHVFTWALYVGRTWTARRLVQRHRPAAAETVALNASV